uniref:C-type lectin domain-containing protein n=1 Tax=Echeneis naucrates TaxID=173247 RepID=A0A665X3U3_ECHNA
MYDVDYFGSDKCEVVVLFCFILDDESSKRSSSELRANLTELLRISEGKLSSLTEERDQLNVSLSEITEECSRLQGWRRRSEPHTHTPKNISHKENCCPAGWKKFSHFCLLLSNETGSWDEGRKDCRARGADLVVIDSPEKQGFLISMSTTETIAWIGLTDRVEEGNWTWINGAPLSEGYWKRSQPDNGGQPRSKTMQEDCAHLTVGLTITNNWNDLPCEWIQKWICEQSSKCDQDGRDGVQMKA